MHVSDLDGAALSLLREPWQCPGRVWMTRTAPSGVGIRGRCSVAALPERHPSPSKQIQYAELRVADARRVLQHCVENRLQARRATGLITLSTSAVAVCCSSDCRNSLSSRVFSMAITAWAAKFCTRSICLSVNGRTSCDR